MNTIGPGDQTVITRLRVKSTGLELAVGAAAPGACPEHSIFASNWLVAISDPLYSILARAQTRFFVLAA